jgi:hypothetical protein
VQCEQSLFTITIDNAISNGTIETDYSGDLTSVSRGTNIAFTFEPADGYELWSATLDGSSIAVDGNNPFVCNINIVGDYTISATFFNVGDNVKKIYVDPAATDANNGTSWTDAYATMGKAFKAMTGSNNIIYLKEGATFEVTDGVSTDSGKLNIPAAATDVTIEGNGATLQPKSATTNTNRMIRANATPTSTFRVRNLTIENITASSHTGAAIFFGGALMEIDNCRFLNNTTASAAGGVIESRIGASHIIIRNSEFSGNDATGTTGIGALGGVIAHAGGGTGASDPLGGSLIIDGCVFRNNGSSASNGSVIEVAKASSDVASWLSKVSVTNSVFYNNGGGSSEKRAAIYLMTPTTNRTHGKTATLFANNTFYGNHNGSIYMDNDKYDITLINNVIAGIPENTTDIGVNSTKATVTVVAKNNTIVAKTAVHANIASAFDATNTLTSTTEAADVTALGLASDLTTPASGLPYLPIVSASSPLIDAGINSHTGLIIPSKDIAGATRANGSYSGDYVDIGAYEYAQYHIWTGNSGTDWATAANWNPTRPPATDKDVVIPAGTLVPVLSAATTTANVTIQPGAGIELGEYTLSAASIKAQKTVEAKQWYSIGFPFDVTSIHSEYYDADLAGDNFWLRKRDTDANEFGAPITGDNISLDAGEGYIIKFPAAFHYPSNISYISSNISNFEKNEDLIFTEDTYVLQANPTLAALELDASGLEDDQFVYQLNSAGTVYTLVEGTAIIAPFESFFTFEESEGGISHAPKIVVDTDVITGIVPAVKNDEVIATEYYNLQGVRVPVQSGNIYIVKQIHQSGKTSVSKVIVR